MPELKYFARIFRPLSVPQAIILFMTGVLLLFAIPSAAQADGPLQAPAIASPVRIGILAKRGKQRCIERWTPTMRYLDRIVPTKKFHLVSLGFDEIFPAVEKGKVDFIFANPSYYVQLEAMYGISRLVTLNNLRLGKAYTRFAGLIFCRTDREEIRTVADLRGRSFMAVDERSFGGWQMAWYEMKTNGIDPYSLDLDFGGTHDAVVHAVLGGRVDAGTVRSDILERMALEKKIDIRRFRVIGAHKGNRIIPFLHSTAHYPEWPMAKLMHTPRHLAEAVAVALLSMPPDSPAAQAALCAGWTVPLNYQPVRDCLKELGIGPFKPRDTLTPERVLRKYWPWLAVFSAFLLLTIGFTFWTRAMNRRLQSSLVSLKTAEAARLKSEERYRGIVEDNTEFIVRWTPDGARTFINQVYADYLTAHGALGKMGSSVFDHLDPQGERDLKARISGLTPDNPIAHTTETKIFDDGTRVWLEWTERGLFDDAGQLKEVQSVGRDVTAARQAEIEKSKHEKKRRQAQKMEAIGTLSGGVAHEFNNLLGIIVGNTELSMEDIPETHPAQVFLDEIKTACLRGGTIVKQLLSFSRKSGSEQIPMDLAGAIHDTLALFRASIPASIEFDIRIPDTRVPILGDPDLIRQVILNLCQNAYHAMETDGGTLSLELDTRETRQVENFFDQQLAPGRYAVFRVEDTGSGIESDRLEKIFDPFYTTKDVDKGAGLGLSAVHGILKEYDGGIRIASVADKGTLVECYFPLTDARPDNRPRPAVPTGGESILFVDDETAIAKMGKLGLERLGYRVKAMTDPVRAAARFEAGRFDMIVTDLSMPGLTGEQLIHRLRQGRPGLKSIICTGFHDKIDPERARELGVGAVLMKPATRNELAVAIRRVLDREDPA